MNFDHTKIQQMYNKRLRLQPLDKDEEVKFIFQYKDIPDKRKYSQRVFDGIKFNKNGQRKLFDGELLFLIKCLSFFQRDDFTVLYVGAADGKHINIYNKLFPNVKWILYDPRDFMIKENDKIEIHQEFFTDELCEKYKGVDAFISDIRTMDEADFKKQDQAVWQQQVEDDQNMQKNWVKMIQPKIFSLKFKLNWNKDKQTYLAGNIYLQPWCSVFSAETRLIGTEYKEIEYDPKEFEEKMFYFNTQMRFQKNQLTAKNELEYYCPCHDCQLECYLIRKYQEYNPKVSDQEIYGLIKKYSIKKM